jgi:hypothetical protein
MKLLAGIILGILTFSRVAMAQHVVINEIMYAPVSKTGEPEWVELFNPTDSAISTIGWSFSNHSHSYPISADTIAPNGYIVLTKDSVNLLRNKYAIPSANILQTTLPALVNTGDVVVIKDSTGKIIDSVQYSPKWGGANGTSLERRDYEAQSDSSNFGSCIAPLGATPSAPNSIARKDFDLAIESFTDSIISPTDISVIASVKNTGRKVVSDGIVSLYAHSTIPISQTQITTPIEPLSKQNISMTWHNADYGRTGMSCIISEVQDELHSNDTIHDEIYFPIPRSAVVINEIMPLTKTGSSEWIELYNNSPCNANLDSTELAVSGIDSIYKFRITSFAMPPHTYGLIIADSNFYMTFPTLRGLEGMKVLNHTNIKLTDSGNMIELLNTDSSIIDSLHFYPTWHSPTVTNHTGISLERKFFNAPSSDPNNWGSSLDPRGSTPLEKNSFSDDTIAAVATIDVTISPNPFSPDGDGFQDAANIIIKIPSVNDELISARLYDLRGRLRSTIASNQRALRMLSLQFTGKDDNGLILPVGLYTLVVESASGLFKPQRTGIVIAKKRQ